MNAYVGKLVDAIERLGHLAAHEAHPAFDQGERGFAPRFGSTAIGFSYYRPLSRPAFFLI